MQSKVSIITTFYNSVKLGDFVHKSMKSLLGQSYPNIEFICVHDGSSDGTLQQLHDYAARDNRIVIIDKKNEGTAQYAKAAGQDAATGEYIMLFDHDDELDRDATALAVQKFAEDPELDMVGMIVKVVYPDGRIKNIFALDENIQDMTLYNDHTLTGTEAVKKTVGKYDFHFRGFVRKKVFKSHSFRYHTKLLNADEIVERMIFGEARKIGICNGVYTHYVFENSSAKSYNIKKTDIIESDMILRAYFKKLGYYEPRKKITELMAYKNLAMGMKIFQNLKKNLTASDLRFYEDRLRRAYNLLDKKILLKNYSGVILAYHALLLSSYDIFKTYYRFKNS